MRTRSSKRSEQEQLSTIKLQNDELQITLLPEMGGKMVDLIRKESGTNFLQQSPVDLTEYRKPESGEEFLPPFAAGFDECFPNVSPSSYEFKNQTVELPDHGELWTKSWHCERIEQGIIMWTTGSILNYRFAKHIQLVGSEIEITYKLESREDVPFDYLWSSHPLLNIQAGDELLLPDEITELLVDWSSDPGLGQLGETVSWPKILGNNSNIDFNYVQQKSMSFAAKLFSQRLQTGKAGIYKKDSDESLMFSFDVEQIPYLGIWLCYGGWPEGDKPKDFTLALEPCIGRPDSLQVACNWGEQQCISPSTIKCWQLSIKTGAGKLSI